MARRNFYKSENFNIIEFTPAPRMISINILRQEMFGKKIKQKFYLSMPYIQFALYCKKNEAGEILSNTFFASFTKKPMTSLDDAVGVPLLPNVHGDLSVLMDAPPDIDVAIETFFSTVFTDRDAFHWPGINATKQLFGDYENWAKQTKEDPKFILNSPLLRPINPVVEGIQVLRSMRYSDIPKMENFLVNTAQKNGEDVPEEQEENFLAGDLNAEQIIKILELKLFNK